jgi:hypothetical protein
MNIASARDLDDRRLRLQCLLDQAEFPSSSFGAR